MTKYCDNCGGPVSNKFHRLYSDNGGNLEACLNCQEDFCQVVYEAQGRDRKETYGAHGRYRR